MEHIVTQQEDGMRLRDMLRRVMDVSYTAMKSAKWEARILVDGQTRTVDRPVHAGETVLFLPAEVMPAYQPKPCNRPVHIVYEDEYLLVVDKDAPLASQSSERQPDDTLENMLFAYFGCPKQFVYRPVNRLDKGTSGLMVVAKSAHAQYQLQRLLHTPAFRRIYLAVVEGSLPRQQGVINAPIAKENAASIRRLVCPEGKQSITHYQVLVQCKHRSLVQLELETGRTHQIRVHMAYVGCPICGDFLYGQELELLPGRFALHSAQLLLIHPFTGKLLDISSPLPASFALLLDEAHP